MAQEGENKNGQTGEDIIVLLQKHADTIKQQNEDSKKDVETQIKNATELFQSQIDEVKKGMTPRENQSSQKLFDTLEKETQAFRSTATSKNSSSTFELVAKSNSRTKAVTQANGLLLNSTADGVRVNPTTIQSEILSDPFRKEHIRDLMPVIAIETDSYQYNYLASYSDGTALKAENTAFTQSSATFKPKKIDVVKIMSGMVVSSELLADNMQLRSFLANQLVQWYYYKEDTVLARGSGTGGEPLGFFTGATAFSAVGGRTYASPTLVHLYRNAALQVAVANFSASAMFMSLGTEMDIDLMQDLQGRFQDTKPQLPYAKFASNFIGNDEFVVGDTTRGCAIIDRTGLDLQYSFEDADNFQKDMVTIRLIKRLAPITFYANAMVKGVISTSLTALTTPIVP